MFILDIINQVRFADLCLAYSLMTSHELLASQKKQKSKLLSYSDPSDACLRNRL